MTGPVLHVEHIAGRVRAWLDGREIPGVADITSRHAAGDSPTVSVELIVSEVRHGAPPAAPRTVVVELAGDARAIVGPPLVRRARPGGNVTRMNFSQALTRIKDGSKLTREGWNGPDQFVALQAPDDMSMMRKPYIYIHPVDGELVPWLASQTDLLAEDWTVVS